MKETQKNGSLELKEHNSKLVTFQNGNSKKNGECNYKFYSIIICN